jgi:LPXTG-site transpeptidase (sortase) family protein
MSTPGSPGVGTRGTPTALGTLVVAFLAVAVVGCVPPRQHVGPVPTRFISPDMGRDLPVFLGVSTTVLDQGVAGWDPESSGLTEAGTVVLFAHRVSRGGPFLTLGRLRPGHLVDLWGSDGQLYRYRVVMTEVTSPSWAAVLAWKPSSGWGLTLVACHPPGSVAQRLVVHAELEQIIPSPRTDQPLTQTSALS